MHEDRTRRDDARRESDAAIVDRCKEQIGHILTGHHYTLLHGCDLRVAPAILEEGLRVRSNSLTYTAKPGQFHDFGELETQDDRSFLLLAKYRGGHHTAIVIISIPHAPPETDEYEFQNSLLVPAPKDLQLRGVRKILPPNFIAGFLDLQKLEFISNKTD